MRVLGRLLGSNIGELVDRIAGMATPGSAAPDVQERILCARCVCVSNSYVRMCVCSSGRILCKMRWFALNFNLFLSVIPPCRLLSAMMRDEENVRALVASDAALLVRVISLIDSPALVDTEAAMALLQVRNIE